MRIACFVTVFCAVIALSIPLFAIEYAYYEHHTGNSLYAIDGSGKNSVWAVGEGLILHWNGNAWNEQIADASVAFSSIAAVDESHAYAVGGETCFYYDGSSWEQINEVNNCQKVVASSSGQAYVVTNDGRDINFYHFDGANWIPASITIKGTYCDCSLTDSNELWIISKKSTDDGLIPPTDIYVSSYTPGKLTEYLLESFPEGYLISSLTTFALDANNVWASLTYYPLGLVAESSIMKFNGIEWNVITNGLANSMTIRALDSNTVYASSSSYPGGMYRLNGNELTVVNNAQSLTRISDFYIADENEFWMIDCFFTFPSIWSWNTMNKYGSAIMHYTDWPLNHTPVGLNLALNGSVGTLGGWWKFKASVQPTSYTFDAYILFRVEKTGKFYSIAPGGYQPVYGIRPYAKQVAGSTNVITKTLGESETVHGYDPTRGIDHQVGIVLMPAGLPLNLENSIGYYVSDIVY
jgi:hypothetical protein